MIVVSLTSFDIVEGLVGQESGRVEGESAAVGLAEEGGRRDDDFNLFRRVEGDFITGLLHCFSLGTLLIALLELQFTLGKALQKCPPISHQQVVVHLVDLFLDDSPASRDLQMLQVALVEFRLEHSVFLGQVVVESVDEKVKLALVLLDLRQFRQLEDLVVVAVGLTVVEHDPVQLQLPGRKLEDVLAEELENDGSCQGSTHALGSNIIYH